MCEDNDRFSFKHGNSNGQEEDIQACIHSPEIDQMNSPDRSKKKKRGESERERERERKKNKTKQKPESNWPRENETRAPEIITALSYKYNGAIMSKREEAGGDEEWVKFHQFKIQRFRQETRRAHR